METIKFILLHIVLPLLIGGLGRYAYPKIDLYLKNRSLSLQERELKSIISDYKIVRLCSENQTHLIILILHKIVIILPQIALLIVVVGIVLIFPAKEVVVKFVQVLIIGYAMGSVVKTDSARVIL